MNGLIIRDKLPTLPETNMVCPCKIVGWKTTFILGRTMSRGELLVLGRAFVSYQQVIGPLTFLTWVPHDCIYRSDTRWPYFGDMYASEKEHV